MPRILLSFLYLILILPLSIASAADYDRDGKDDLEVVEVKRPNPNQNSGTTNWYVRKSSTGKIVVYKFKVPAAAFIRLRRTDGKIYPGVVWVRSVNSPLEWFIKSAKGETHVLYGQPGDMIPNQGDLDRDGIDDLTVVRKLNGGNLQWISKLSRTRRSQSTIFGTNGEKLGIGPDGMLMAVDSNFHWSGKLFSEAIPSFNKDWGVSGDIPLFGRSPGQVAVARAFGNLQKLYVSNKDGSSLLADLGPLTSVPTIGNFFGPYLSYGWHDRAKKSVSLTNSRTNRSSKAAFGSTAMSIILPSGQVIPAGTSGAFTTPAGGGGNGGSGGGGNGGSGGGAGGGAGGGSGGGGSSAPPTNPGLQTVCPTVRDLQRQEVWKAIASTHIPNTDPRRFSTSFITLAGFPAPALSCLPVYDGSGNLVHQLGRYFPTGAAYSSRNYGGSGCGDKKTATAVAATARSQTGSATVYIKINSGQCVRIPTPSSCFNSSGC